MRGKYYKEKPEHAMRAHNIQTQLTLRDYKRLPEYHWSIDFKEANELTKVGKRKMVWAEATAVTGEVLKQERIWVKRGNKEGQCKHH